RVWRREWQILFRPFEIVSHRAGRHRATAANLPNGKLMLKFKSKYFSDLTHGFVGSCHWLPFHFEKGSMVPTYPASLLHWSSNFQHSLGIRHSVSALQAAKAAKPRFPKKSAEPCRLAADKSASLGRDNECTSKD